MDALDGIRADAVHQWLEEHGAIQPEETAHGKQCEAEAELDSGPEVRGDDNEQRETAGTIGHPGRDEPDC
jgi:hypothetical protein